jgi:hypothetical protein
MAVHRARIASPVHPDDACSECHCGGDAVVLFTGPTDAAFLHCASCLAFLRRVAEQPDRPHVEMLYPDAA